MCSDPPYAKPRLSWKSTKGTSAGLPCGYLDLKAQTFDTGAVLFDVSLQLSRDMFTRVKNVCESVHLICFSRNVNQQTVSHTASKRHEDIVLLQFSLYLC